ncbi:MAG: hypothetical protein RBR93_12625 [Aliarcobacter butzleri]|nr:hypothetical protein [Aliarcobacter butzleri]
MGKHYSNYERLETVKKFKDSNLSISEFSRVSGVNRTTLRDWVNAFDNIDGSFVRLNKNEKTNGDGVVLSNDDAVVKLLTTEQIYKKSNKFSRFDHSIVVIEFEKIKITTSLEQALSIMEKYYDRFI